MQAHHRTEHAPLEPADQQLLKRRIVDVAALKTADVGRPPRNTRQPHVQASSNLIAQRVEGRVDVAGPRQHAVTLAARPGAAHQIDDLVFAFLLQSVVKTLGEFLRIDIPHFQHRAEVIAIVIKIIRTVFRFGFIQPESADAQIEIVLFHFVPDKLTCAGMRGIKERAVAEEIQIH